jgi:hypothetical protein
VLWLKSGDANTSFFHIKIKSHRLRNFIFSLNSKGSSVTSHKDKEDAIHNVLGTKEERTSTALNAQHAPARG